ncbi:hypothetical protein ACH4NS_37285 [Streptomyces mutabilis]
MSNGRNADPTVVVEKKNRIRDTHVAALNSLADRIADSVGLPHGHVPYVDPDLGGIDARVLVLLDNPSTKAEAGTGSGLLSLDNNDRTARNCREAYARAGISWSDVVHWNVVPFPVSGVKNGGSTPAERARSAQWTREFVALCPNLEIVLLLGVAARDGWERAGIERDVYVVPGNIPHCSDRGLNSAGGRERFDAAITDIARMLSTGNHHTSRKRTSMNETPSSNSSLSEPTRPGTAAMDLFEGAGPGSELAVSVEPEGILVAGDPEVVAGYLARLTDLAGEALDVSGVSTTSMANVAAAAVGAKSIAAQAGQFVRLSPNSVQALKTYKALPGDSGFFRMTVVDQAGKFRQQLQWQKVSLGPTQALSFQLIAVQVALSVAIASVNESIARVDGKVEQLLALAQASRVGDVVGHFTTLDRLVTTLDEHGTLPTADWESVAGLRPTLNVTIERLREHVKRTLAGFDATRPVQDRADYLRRAIEENRLGESLHLLVVGEQSLYLWQRLRIARVQATEPQHLQVVLDDARTVLAEHFERDGELLLHARSELSNFAKMHRLDGFRWGAAHNLKHDIVKLKNDLDDFAQARGSQVMGWTDHESPSVVDALAEVGSRAASAGSAVAGAAGKAIGAGVSGVGSGLGWVGRGIGNLVGSGNQHADKVEIPTPTTEHRLAGAATATAQPDEANPNSCDGDDSTSESSMLTHQPDRIMPSSAPIAYDDDILQLMLFGHLQVGDQLTYHDTGRGLTYIATITRDGALDVDGKRYGPPSAPLTDIMGRQRHGWRDWQLADGRQLRQLRRQAYAEMRR